MIHLGHPPQHGFFLSGLRMDVFVFVPQIDAPETALSATVKVRLLHNRAAGAPCSGR